MLENSIARSIWPQRTAAYRVWSPPETSVRIEYSIEVLREAARAQKGVLYGARDGATVRVIAARRKQCANDDPRLAGLELVGTFAARPRGEIFLTEADLEHLEITGGSIALAIAGTNAGFFVYEPDGAIQTIKSHREFSFAALPPPRKNTRPPKRWIALALIAAVILLSSRRLAPAHPLALQVRESAGQLLISWNRNASATRLEIEDGDARDWIPVTNLASATYVRSSGDVRIRLIDGARGETAHFVGEAPMSAPANDITRDIARLQADASALRARLEAGRLRTAQLEERIRRRIQ